MAKEKIVIGINSLVSTVHAAYSNHVQLFFKLGKHFGEEFDFIFVNPPRMSIDRMRNMAASVAIQADAKYLIFIDDDVLVPFDFLSKLLWDVEQEGNDVVCGNVQIRGYPFDYMIFRWDEDRTGLFSLKELPLNEGSLIPVDAVGFSCVIIKVELLRKLSKPYFITTHNMTEDITFCLKAAEEFPETKFACDTSIVCGHILWSEMISESNRAAYTEYFEKLYPQVLIKEDECSDRGMNYLESLKGATQA